MKTTATHTEGFIQAKQPWLRKAGIFSLFLYAFFWLLDIEISRIGESLMFLFFVIMLFTNKPKFLLREPIPYLLLGWIVFQVAMYQWAVARFPELATDHINEARIITNIFLFIVIAWWLGGSTILSTTILLLCAVGYLFGITFHDGGLLDSLHKLKDLDRMDYGNKNEQHTAVYSTFILLVCITLKKRIFRLMPQNYKLLAKTFIYIASTYTVVVIITSQARATWVGLTVIGIVYTIGFLLHKFRKAHDRNDSLSYHQSYSSLTTPVILVVIIITIATLLSNITGKDVFERIYKESETIEKLLDGETYNIQAKHSVGIRISSWRMALKWIKERPLTGWGPQSRKVLLMESDWPKRLKKRYGHLHNSYIEILVDYGFLGIALFTTLFCYIWYRAWQSWKAEIIPNDIMLFASIWTTYWLIVNIFESYIIFSATGNYVIAIVMGILYSYHLKNIQQKTVD